MAIHTLTLGRQPLQKRVYNRLRTRIFLLSEEREASIDYCKRHSLQCHMANYPGISIALYYRVVPRLELTINPSIVMGGGYADLCTFDDVSLKLLSDIVTSVLAVIGAPILFSDLCLTRIDCTADVALPTADCAAELIGCVKRAKLGRGYELDSFGRSYPDYKEKNRHSFRAKCKDVCLTIYDKSYQLQEQGLMKPEDIPQNRLRIEAAFENASFQRIFCEHISCRYTDLTLGKQILFFSDLSIHLLQKYFQRVLMSGRYMRFDVAEQEIEHSTYSHTMKDRMKTFLHEVAAHSRYGVDGAIAACNLTGIEVRYLLKCFRDLNLNPATLPYSSKVEQLPEVHQLLEENCLHDIHADSLSEYKAAAI